MYLESNITWLEKNVPFLKKNVSIAHCCLQIVEAQKRPLYTVLGVCRHCKMENQVNRWLNHWRGRGTQAQNRMWRSKQFIHVNKRKQFRNGWEFTIQQYGKHASHQTGELQYETWYVSPITRSCFTVCSRIFLPSSVPFVNMLTGFLRTSQKKAYAIDAYFWLAFKALPSFFSDKHQEKKKKVKWPVTWCLCLSATSGLSCPQM